MRTKLRRPLCLLASAGGHAAVAVLVALAWPVWFLGHPCDDPYVFSYDNPFFRSRPPAVSVVVRPPRKSLAELIAPDRPSRDSMKLEFQDSPGRPWLESGYRQEPIREDAPSRAEGVSEDFVSDKPYRGMGTYDSAGVGTAGGGRYGTAGNPDRFGKDSIHLSLFWLSRHRNPDGSWSDAAYTSICNAPHGRPPCESRVTGGGDAASTALAVLAFLGAGYTRFSRDTWDGICFGRVVDRGLRWIAARQDSDGRLAADPEVHAICALALAEACRLTPFRDHARAARRAAEVAAATPIQGWAALAIRSASRAGLRVPPAAVERARAWLDEEAADPFLRSYPASWGAWDMRDFPRGYFTALSPEGRVMSERIDRLVSDRQNRDETSCRYGSLEWPRTRGRVSATALHALALEACPRSRRFGR